MKTLIRSVNRSPLCCGFLTLAIALAWFALSPPIKAQCPSACGAGGNTAVGNNALDSVTSGFNNTAVGSSALTADTTGSFNVAIGGGALQSNTTGQQNMAIGTEALRDSNGNFNMAIGFRALFLNTGSRNSAVGAAALRNNTTAEDNTAIGSTAMRENTTGNSNTAIGSAALRNNTTGEGNVAVGGEALVQNEEAGNGTTSINGPNTAVGFKALEQANTDSVTGRVGDADTAIGWLALQSNTTGQGNTALGSLALQAENGATSDRNTAVGRRALEFLMSGSDNTAVGWRAGDNYIGAESGNVAIGEVAGVAGENNTTRIANILGTFQPFSPGVVGFVTVGPGGKLGNGSFSSRRFKDDIKPMDKASEQLFALKPVTFRFKQEFEPTHSPQFGLIAEDVAKVNPNLVIRGEDGKVQGVRYDSINNMLLNEFLKEHKKVQELEATVAQQQKGMEVLAAQIKEQAAQIQKVSAQLETNKPAMQVVNNNK